MFHIHCWKGNQPVTNEAWVYEETTLDDLRIHPEAKRRAQLLLDHGVRVQYFVYGKEVEVIQPKRELNIDIDWETIAKVVAIGAFVLAGGLLLLPLLLLGVGLAACVSSDPALYAVLADEEQTVIELLRWYDD